MSAKIKVKKKSNEKKTCETVCPKNSGMSFKSTGPSHDPPSHDPPSHDSSPPQEKHARKKNIKLYKVDTTSETSALVHLSITTPV